MAKSIDSNNKKIPYDPRMSQKLNAKRERLNWQIDETEKSKKELLDFINHNKEQFGLESNQHVTDIKAGPNADWNNPVMKVEIES